MALNKFVQDTKAKAVEVNENFNTSLSGNIINKISMLENHTLTESAGQNDIFAEAYIDSTGRQDYVNTSGTDAQFDTNKYIPSSPFISTGTDNDSGWTNPSNAFDSDDNTYANVAANPSIDEYIGKTFTSKFINQVRVVTKFIASGSNLFNGDIAIESYNGSVWSHEGYIYGPISTNLTTKTTYTFSLNKNVQGIRVRFTGDAVRDYEAEVYSLEYNGEAVESVIEHDIPTGFFGATPSSLIGMPKIADWEDGANIQVKVTNATEDSGYVDYGEVLNFTAFTSEPSKFLVKLIPKTSGATAGYPSVYGAGCIVK